MITFAITIYKMIEKSIQQKIVQFNTFYGYPTRKYITEAEMDKIMEDAQKKIDEELDKNKTSETIKDDEKVNKKKREKVKSGYINSGTIL